MLLLVLTMLGLMWCVLICLYVTNPDVRVRSARRIRRDVARADTPLLSGSSLNMSNAETIRAFADAGFSLADATAATKPPTRKIVPLDTGCYSVSDSAFITTDRTLAESVAAEFDRIEPLQRRT